MTPHFGLNMFSMNVPTLTKYTDTIDGGNGLEIGCWEGMSTLWFLERGAKVTCVDPFTGGPPPTPLAGPELLAQFLENTKEFEDRMEVLKEKSEDALPRLIADGRKFDWIYIDGSHLFENVITDAILSHLLLRVGGLMIFDDYDGAGGEGVTRAIDTFVLVFSSQIEPLELQGVRCAVLRKRV